MNHLALIEKTTSLIAAGDIVGAESALAELADEEGDRALMVVLDQLAPKDVLAVMREYDSSKASVVNLLVTPEQFARAMVLEKQYKDLTHQHLRNMVNAVVFREDAEPLDFLTAIGDLEGGAEALARPVGKSGLRVVASTPDGIDGPMGLGAIPSLVVAVLCGLLAVVALLVARGKLNLKPRSRTASPSDDGEPTLGQTLQREPLPSASVRERNEENDKDVSVVTANTSKTIAVDPGIFRAYDIRGIVGTTLSVDVAERIG